MPFYTIVPSRRSMSFNPFFSHGYGAPRHHSPCAPRSNPTASLLKSLDSDFSCLDSFFNELLSPQHKQSSAIRSFQPRFDVREEADAFHLTGDLPGVEAGNIAVEFVDRDTMVVKGRTVRESKRGNAPAADTTPEDAREKTFEGDDAMETEQPTTATTTDRPATPDSSASNYHQATVEDSRDEEEEEEEEGDDFVDVAAENSNNNESAATEKAPVASSSENTTAVAPQQQQQQQASPAAKDQSRYWVSERSVGEFSRSFRFPGGQVDRENVTASLKDGVLKVVVPKAKEQGARRIRVD